MHCHSEIIGISNEATVKDFRKAAVNFMKGYFVTDGYMGLADAVGLDITVDETESSVGDFNVDIYASETGTDRKIIIENQLEDTDHDHLEYDERIFESAEANREHAVSGRKVSFELTSAEKYTVPSEVDRCYFFNPFSVEILRKVLAGIYESYYEKPREILLMFYYPSEEYLGCLMTEEQLMFYDEINTEDLFEGKNDREKILIFSVD